VVVETEDFTLGCWVNPGKSQKQWANILSRRRYKSVLLYCGRCARRLLAWSRAENPTGNRCLAAFCDCTRRRCIDTLS
jgi:hypothetical protein